MGTAEELFLRLPYSLRCLAASIKSAHLNMTRRGGRYKEFRSEIESRVNWSSSDFSEYQDEQLRRLFSECLESVPYYQNCQSYRVLGSRSESPSEILLQLPILEKSVIRGREEQFVSARVPRKNRLRISTTGTTGTPLTVWTSETDRQRNFAFFDSFLGGVGVNLQGRRVVIGGRLLVPEDASSPPYWVRDVWKNTLLMSAYHISEATISSYAQKLRMYRPDYIEAYPSALSLIAAMANKKNLPLPTVPHIVTSSETLSSSQRSAIESAFNAQVFDQYGTAEMSVFVAECPHRRYHARSDFGVLEVDGAQQVGDFVCTSFVNQTMPLLRYRIGDAGKIGVAECVCGQPGPIVEAILGRVDDVIIAADGRRIGRMSPVLKGFPIIESQFRQDEVGKVRLLVVPAPGYSTATTSEILAAINRRLGSNTEVDLQLVERIERGAGGKVKSVVSTIL